MIPNLPHIIKIARFHPHPENTEDCNANAKQCVGKTTLAQIIARSLDIPFFTLSAIDSGVKEVRAVIEQARLAGHALLFIDEIHRFNKAQQDSLLGAVEKGIITLIGATTENPSFEVISALLSRSQVYTMKPLTEEHLMALVQNAMEKDEELRERKIIITEWSSLHLVAPRTE